MDNQDDQNLNDTYSVQMEDKRETSSGTISEDTDADITQVASRLQETLDLTTPTSTQLDAMETLRNSTIADPDLTLTQTDSSQRSQIEEFVTANETLLLEQYNSDSISFPSQSMDNTVVAGAGASSSHEHEKYALKLQAAKGCGEFFQEQENSFIPGPSRLNKSFGKSKIPILPGSNIMANQQLRLHCGWDSSPHPHTSTPIPDLIRVPQGQSMNLQGTNNKA